MKKLDWVGRRYGRLEVVEEVRLPKRGTFLSCKCDCGTVKVMSANNLRSGATNSCGCLRSELLVQENITHGASSSRLFGIWSSMKNRCSNPKTQFYYRYGGRGIKVCQEWKVDFAAFQSWALSSGYQNGLLLERVNNDGNYSPDNCTWATHLEQSRNTSRNVRISICGKSMILADALIFFGITSSCYYRRIKAGWPTEKAITAKPLRGKRLKDR